MSSHYYCSNCGNVGVFYQEAGAMSVSYPEVSNGTESLRYPPLEYYPLAPLLEESSTGTQATDQSWATQPEPQSEHHFDPCRVGQFFLDNSTTMWPLHVAQLNGPFPIPYQTLADPCPQQLEQRSPVDNPASSQEARVVEPSNSPRQKRQKRQKPPAEVDDDLPILTKPFSEVLEGEDAIAEATEFANRSVEQRRWEAQVAGKVKKPTNSFILYRSTYLGGLRGYASTNASKLLAKSWAMEPNSVRQAFQEIADTDKSLHAQAFPAYKFNARKSLKSRKLESRNKRREF